MPDSPIDASRADAVADTFATAYSTKSDPVRRGIDLALDAVEDEHGSGSFTGRPSGRDKAQYLRGRALANGRLQSSNLQRRNLVLRAIAMASAPFATETVRDPSIIFLSATTI